MFGQHFVVLLTYSLYPPRTDGLERLGAGGIGSLQ